MTTTEDKPRLFGTRDAFWLAVLCLVLAIWGWDRGRLAARLEAWNTPVTPMLAPLVLDRTTLRGDPVLGSGIQSEPVTPHFSETAPE